MNEELLKLYKKYWTSLVNSAAELGAECKKQQPSHPLLIKVTEEYESAQIKVMIVGQETNGWCKSFVGSEYSAEGLSNVYYNYFYEKHKDADKNKEVAKCKNSRPFFNNSNLKYFKSKIEKEFGKKHVGFVWNNLSKIGKNDKGSATDKIKKLEENYFKDVHREELRILKPNIIIFNTGNNRDHLLKERFDVSLSNASYSKSKHEIAKVSFSEGHKHIISYRTFHPNAWAHVKTRKNRNRYIAEQVIRGVKGMQ